MRKDDAFDPEHLNIAFHAMQPEMVLNSIRGWYRTTGGSFSERVYSNEWGDYAYHHYSIAKMGTYRTDDEAQYLAAHFEKRMKNEGDSSVFQMLRRYAHTLLTSNGTEPLCRYERILRWRLISLKLGQDLFTTCYTASEDIKNGRQRTNFLWPAIIGTDNTRLTQIMAKGLAENHFHLTGSTRMFSLSWICMMNHPGHINLFFRDKNVRNAFRDRLDPTISANPTEHSMKWEELLMYAAYLRARLFERSTLNPGNSSGKWVHQFLEFDQGGVYQIQEIRKYVEAFRYQPNAARLAQKDSRPKVLDYALTEDLISSNNDHNRLLAGERRLLYNCFRKCFEHSFSPQEQDCFYLYLLLKNQFRSELIQVNGRVGFQNFSRYQDRKGFFWESFPEYWDESIRLSVNATLQKGYVRALEARICPGDTVSKQFRKIRENDESYGFAVSGISRPTKKQLQIIEDSPLFYVLHFPKNTREIQDCFCSESVSVCSGVYPRNSVVRRDTERQARAIAKALASSPYLRKRIRGIDACSNEIGCRPETFATEFRYLRSGIPCTKKNLFVPDTDNEVRLFATYHAGEDFLDLIDGLRAIDEAVQFLNLKRGDRLGHALALGVAPTDYYHLKHERLIITRQELLDNLIWILYRSREFGVTIPRELAKKLEQRAYELMHDIGYDANTFHFRDYYHSWCLRGDHPDIFLHTKEPVSLEQGGYDIYRKQTGSALEQYRNNDRIRQLCMLYHFDNGVKDRGKVKVAYKVEPGIATVIEELQLRMQHDLMEKGICIECNPSSNVLIGSFGKYREHPLFRFNRHGICVPRWEHEISANLSVSLNTDDQGVFDTSLESEYAYVARSMEREYDDQGNRLNSNDDIYDYLDHLRILGNSQTFHHKGEEIFFSRGKEYVDFQKILCESYNDPIDLIRGTSV